MRLVCLTLACAAVLPAQQTIFDVPSADVAGRREWFYQHQSVARSWGEERRWIQTHAFGYGLGGALELDGTWFNVERGAVAQSAPSVGFKWSPRLTPEHSAVPLRFVAGQMVTVGRRRGSWSYLMLNGEVPSSRTHLTGGFTVGTKSLFGERTTGVLLGVEQHLNRRWTLQADWFSGRHDLAYLIPGIVCRTSAHWMVSLGYQSPNPRARGFGAVVIELTRQP